jgi:hypothetical protein
LEADKQKKDPAAQKQAKKAEEMERARDYDQMRRLKENNPEQYKKLTGRDAAKK